MAERANRKPGAVDKPRLELLRELSGHENHVLCVAFTPDGKRAVSGSADQTLKVWDVESGAEVQTLKGHIAWIWSVAVFPDGRRCVSASADHSLRIWDLETGEEEKCLVGQRDWIRAVALSPDGRFAVSGSRDSRIRIWDIKNGNCTKTLKGHTAEVFAVAVTPNGEKIVSASFDQTVKVWDFKTGNHLHTLRRHAEPVYSVAATSESLYGFSASADRYIKIWNLDKGMEVSTLRGGKSAIRSVVVTADGKRVIGGDDRGVLNIWDLERRAEPDRQSAHNERISAIALTTDEQQVISASYDGTMKIWKPMPQKEPEPSAEQARASRIPEQNVLAAESADGTTDFRSWAAGDNGYFQIISSDVADSTHFLENHGGNGFRDAFLPRFRQARTLAEQHGGYLLEKATGDGFIGFFRESRPAVEFALKFVGEPGRLPEYPKRRLIERLFAWLLNFVRRIAQGSKPAPQVSRQAPTRSGLTFGIGIDFGVVETKTVNLSQSPIARACRIADFAKKDEQAPVWTANQIRQDIVDKYGLKQTDFEWIDKGECKLKGLSEPQRLWGVKRGPN